ELKATYELYQDLLFAIQSKNVNRFNHLLETEHPMISPELQTSFQTFKTYTSYIYNTLTTPYTNGPIEGINNKIKVIKRIALKSSNVSRLDIAASIISNQEFL
ncbi:ISL3 family transposase, partial [Turicibacter sanguinis]|nr:ISL3 family transposase [Turicibacter sanguinis]MTL88285.1 ISL3 family transposase [Turicibacter sanguinis]